MIEAKEKLQAQTRALLLHTCIVADRSIGHMSDAELLYQLKDAPYQEVYFEIKRGAEQILVYEQMSNLVRPRDPEEWEIDSLAPVPLIEFVRLVKPEFFKTYSYLL